ncbi:MAG: hypothetical protein C5B52_15355 [Bacteroidetes bacterium]|nr:MAG: hypothetical protein C5B52_15355 [Bacteroidota bacterium]
MDEQFGKLIEPEPVRFSYGAPGWYVLATLSLLLILFAVWIILRYRQKNHYRKTALQFLDNTSQKLIQENRLEELVYESNMLIKRIAMSFDERSNVAGKRNHDWIVYINTKSSPNLFDYKDQKLLEQKIYAANEKVSAEEARSFLEKTKKWIRIHKRRG